MNRPRGTAVMTPCLIGAAVAMLLFWGSNNRARAVKMEQEQVRLSRRDQMLRLLVDSAGLGDARMVETILRQVPREQAESRNLLYQAANNGRVNVVRLLLDQGWDPNGLYGGGGPLRAAASVGSLEAVKLLIERGARVDAGRGLRWTALCWAARNGRPDVIRLLAEAGADVNAPVGMGAMREAGSTPLMIAARSGRAEAVKTLLHFRADPSLHNPEGLTALDIAEKEGHAGVAALLRKAAPAVLPKASVPPPTPPTRP